MNSNRAISMPQGPNRRPTVQRDRRPAGTSWGLALSRGLVVGLTLTLMPTSCGNAGSAPGPHGERQHGRHGPPSDDAPALKVASTHLEPRRIDRSYTTSGTLRAIISADIVATQPAVIVSLPIQEGDRVRAGDVLAKLDPRGTALEAAQNQVQLENLQRELDRLQRAPAGVISPEEIDKQRYAVEEARAALRLSKHQVGQTIVRAPFSGTITARLAEVGGFATSSTVLVSLADVDTLELELYVPERDAATVKLGADVDIELLDGSHFAATIVRRAPVVDPTTGTVKLTARADKFPAIAAPGAFARATILVDHRDNAPSLPRSAVFEVEGKPHVFVISDGKAHRKPVTLGLAGPDVVEIIDGLTHDDIVVSDGNMGITEGMPVVPGG